MRGVEGQVHEPGGGAGAGYPQKVGGIIGYHFAPVAAAGPVAAVGAVGRAPAIVIGAEGAVVTGWEEGQQVIAGRVVVVPRPHGHDLCKGEVVAGHPRPQVGHGVELGFDVGVDVPLTTEEGLVADRGHQWALGLPQRRVVTPAPGLDGFPNPEDAPARVEHRAAGDADGGGPGAHVIGVGESGA